MSSFVPGRPQSAIALLAAIVDSSDDAIVSKDLNGIITSWNRGAERLFGYTSAEAVGQPVLMLIPADRVDEEREILARLRRGDRVDHFETVRVRKDGSFINVSLTISPVQSADGVVIGASKIARDITELKRAAETLREREHQLQVVMDTAPALISYVGADGRYLLVNRQYELWFGHAREQIVGRTISEVVGDAAMAVLQPHIDAVLRGEMVHFETQAPYREGGTRWIDAQYIPDRLPDGTVRGFFVFVVDISERRRVEESLRASEQALRESDRRKDEFLAVLAHELRNPLAPIRNSIHILRLTSQLDPAARRVSDMMERQVNHMVRLVDDLLEVSRITSGKIELRREIVNVADAVRSAVEASRPLIQGGGHDLTVTLPTEPLQLEGDPVRLAQIVSNLLNNAAKYTDRLGRIWLTVSRDDNWAVITVRDTGMGVPPELLPRVFDLFMQVDRRAGNEQAGLGIGLALVKSLAELHGGSVKAHSDGPGQGSEFVVRLPIAAVRTTAAPLDGVALPNPASLAARRVLVVDDNRDAAQSLGLLLRLLGADVQVAFSGQEALDAVDQYKPGVLLLDIGMDGIDGLEVARRLRLRPDHHELTLIALTGWGQEEDRRRSHEAGFDYHLIKPVEIGALQALLTSLDGPRTLRPS